MIDNSVERKSAANEATLELIKHLSDPAYLPGRDEVIVAFPPDAEKRLFTVCTENSFPIFEIFTREYISALSSYLSKRLTKLGASPSNPLTVLEVGAGDGRLTHFLSQGLSSELRDSVKFIAVDDGSWESHNVKPLFPVEKQEFQAALSAHQPDIVISSWMPLGEDWTPAFRACSSVQEYLLIGGDSSANDAAWGTPDEQLAADGFEEKFLPDLSQLQICRGDSPPDLEFHRTSRTISFRRK